MFGCGELAGQQRPIDTTVVFSLCVTLIWISTCALNTQTNTVHKETHENTSTHATHAGWACQGICSAKTIPELTMPQGNTNSEATVGTAVCVVD